MKNLTICQEILVSLCLLLSISAVANAQYSILHTFTGGNADGSSPLGSLIQTGSTFYGTTWLGGSNSNGTIFKINTDGTGYQVLHSFISPGTDGAGPFGSLLLSDTILYGMASSDETSFGGTIFRINTDGSGFQVLHSFVGGNNDGKRPYNSLMQIGQILYGTTSQGGSYNNGTLFSIKTDGTGFQLLHTFTGGQSDGGSPRCSLFQSGSFLYGMTYLGGSHDRGTIFRISSDGTGFQLLHSFSGSSSEGDSPYSSSFIQSGVALYGMTSSWETNAGGSIFKIDTDGTNFQLLHRFIGGTNDGWMPMGSLIQSGTALYGMSSGGFVSSYKGTIFKINIDGTGFQLVHSFTGGINDGAKPWGSLIISDSTLYGMTREGGSQNLGVIFALDLRQSTGIHEEKGVGTIENFRLKQNYPNPFNPSTIIKYQLSNSSNIKLKIYDTLGREIKTLVNSFQNSGEQSVIWDSTDDSNNPVSSGIYFYSLETDALKLQKKMVLIR